MRRQARRLCSVEFAALKGACLPRSRRRPRGMRRKMRMRMPQLYLAAISSRLMRGAQLNTRKATQASRPAARMELVLIEDQSNEG
jgi:hypothetical protein